jgi:hypothetical protein
MPSDLSLYVEATDAGLVLAIARGQLEGLAQMSSGATRDANSSTRLLPSAGHPQTR